MTNSTCSVDECKKPIKRLGLCYGHYMKKWRYGTPTPDFGWTRGERQRRIPAKTRRVLQDLAGQRFGALVALCRVPGGRWTCQCDCGRMVQVRTGDLNRGTRSCGTQGGHRRRGDAGYVAAHDRVRRDRGDVKRLPCVDCGGQARHWSYNHDDPDELVSNEKRTLGIAYSLKPEHYSPRCVPCHKRFDLGRLAATPTKLIAE